jgi:hypothetical protein
LALNGIGFFVNTPLTAYNDFFTLVNYFILTKKIKKDAYLYKDETDNPFCRDYTICCGRKGTVTSILWRNEWHATCLPALSPGGRHQ